MADRKPDTNDQNRQEGSWDTVIASFTALIRGLGRLFTDPDQPRLAVRSPQGIYLFRIPIALAALIGLFLLWKALLVLALIVVAVLVTRSSFVLIRPTAQH